MIMRNLNTLFGNPTPDTNLCKRVGMRLCQDMAPRPPYIKFSAKTFPVGAKVGTTQLMRIHTEILSCHLLGVEVY